jgi:hypothetical protein
MEHHLVSYAEAARRSGIPERTLRRWTAEGVLDHYWWSANPQDKGPRVSLQQIQSIRGMPLRSPDGHRTFEINTPRRGYVTITEIDTGATSGAVALWDAIIERAEIHPDGLLILTAGNIGKITKNDKGAWTYGPCTRADLDATQVDGQQPWESAASTLMPE